MKKFFITPTMLITSFYKRSNLSSKGANSKIAAILCSLFFTLTFFNAYSQDCPPNSFADKLVEYDAMGCNISPFATNPMSAIGAPDYVNVPTPDRYVSIGKNGGFITLEFTDNVLTNNGTPDDDLFVFEIGPAVEGSNIWLKPSNTSTETELMNANLPQDGNGFYFVASIGGATAGVDVDQIGTYAAGYLSFNQVKIVSPQTGGCGGQSTHGPDIDAVCALSSVFCGDVDSDCDGINDDCDVCPDGDDSVDNNENGVPDCSELLAYDEYSDDWKCANNKINICHNGNTLCISKNALAAHFNNHGDAVGPCTSCPEQGMSAPPGNSSFSPAKIDAHLEIELFPNPARDILNVHLHGADLHKARIIIHDSLGKIVLQKNLVEHQTTLQVDLSGSSFMTGIYMVTMISEEEIISKRILVSK